MSNTIPQVRSAFSATGPLKPPGRTMAFVVDVQAFDMMSRADAEAYAQKLGGAIEDLRAQGLPVAWLSMSDHNELIPAEITPSGGKPSVRALDRTIGREFYGWQDGHDNADIYRQFWNEHGPRTDEAIYCKYFKNAFAVPEDANGNPAYKALLESESGLAVDANDAEFQHRPVMTDWARGVDRLILMGAVSSHCISETAAGAVAHGITPVICPDLVLSWDGDQEAKIDPKISRLLFEEGAASESPLSYHAQKIHDKLYTIAVEQKDVRCLSDVEANAILGTRIIPYADLAGRLSPVRFDAPIAAPIAAGAYRPIV